MGRGLNAETYSTVGRSLSRDPLREKSPGTAADRSGVAAEKRRPSQRPSQGLPPRRTDPRLLVSDPLGRAPEVARQISHEAGVGLLSARGQAVDGHVLLIFGS